MTDAKLKCSFYIAILETFNCMQTNEHSFYRLDAWLLGFYGISTFVGYLRPNPFLYKLVSSISNNSIYSNSSNSANSV